MKNTLLIFFGLFAGSVLFSQADTTSTTSDSTKVKFWNNKVVLALNYNTTKLDNPPIGFGVDQAGGNLFLQLSANWDNKVGMWWTNNLTWKFGLYRIGKGPIALGSDQKIPFQKALDQLEITSIYGFEFTKDKKWSYMAGFNLFTQATPSYADPNGEIRGLFLRDIRNSSINSIRSRLFSPVNAIVSAGIVYRPSPKVMLGFSPAAYKGIIVLDDNVAQLVGQVDANGLPTATVHGNRVEIENGVPVFRNSFNQFGAYFRGNYNDTFFKNRIEFNTQLQLLSLIHISEPTRPY